MIVPLRTSRVKALVLQLLVIFDLFAKGTFSFDGGPMPGQMSAKTWLWTGDQNSGSHNLAMHGTIAIISRSATEVRGNVDFRVTEYFSDISIGTVRGPFVANVADCSTHTGGWPM